MTAVIVGTADRPVPQSAGRELNGTGRVLKKLFKLVTVSALLAGCYLGYVRAFAIVVGRLTAARKVDDIRFVERPSRSKEGAIALARESFGPDHWTANSELQLRYYNTERGFWMYSQSDQRVIEEDGVRYDGKRIKLKPAAIIWRARDGSSTKTVTSDEAIIDFNQPLSFNVKPDGEPLVVKYARLLGNVMIRDDRGTPARTVRRPGDRPAHLCRLRRQQAANP